MLVKVEGILGRDESVYEEKQVRYQTEQLINEYFEKLTCTIINAIF